MLRINGYKTTTKFITHMNTSYHTATHSLPYCKFYNIFLLPVKNVSSLSLSHIHFFSNLYYLHIMISLFVAFSSINWKNENIPLHKTRILWFANFYQIMNCQSTKKNLPRFFFFPFHDSLHINLCLTLIQYIQFIYATLGCRQFTFSNFLATAKLWYSTNL